MGDLHLAKTIPYWERCGGGYTQRKVYIWINGESKLTLELYKLIEEHIFEAEERRVTLS